MKKGFSPELVKAMKASKEARERKRKGNIVDIESDFSLKNRIRLFIQLFLYKRIKLSFINPEIKVIKNSDKHVSRQQVKHKQ